MNGWRIFEKFEYGNIPTNQSMKPYHMPWVKSHAVISGTDYRTEKER